MYELTVERIGASDITTHPTRELAHTHLLHLLAATGEDARAVDAGWTRTRYEIRSRTGDVAVTGRAVIAQLCGCGHGDTDHHGHGCLGTASDGRDCACPNYAADDEPAALFGATDFTPTPAVSA
ncbi:hypothetical protein [Mycobacterium sp. GA-2829]|uniref:hypothetical protein n=1 Tax=Mycobacterium sp. GA-2829 TaxID=1772283 RepID=UPI0007403CCA|nr:hypothetical protein [Mycobacterium sp. GA-2829]KUI34194.1 hypothetical protein AU194_17745 [Mycobacterium sp. GA-2829]